MTDFDALIGRALTDEDRALLARHGELGYVTQALGLFRGPGAAVMRLVYALILLAFAGAIVAAWQLWQAIDAVAAVRWAVVTLALLLVTVQLKLVLGQRLESDRVRREIKRLELQVALLRDGAR